MRATVTGPLRLIRSIRGEGTLLWAASSGQTVSYSIDLYRQGRILSGNGDVRGSLTSLVGRNPPNVRLRLANGLEVSVALTDIEADTATFDLLDPPPLLAT
jgi:hypothetical protein